MDRQTIFTEWLAALRSDEYNQLKGHLGNTNSSFCCLGILCTIWPEQLLVEIDGNDNILFNSEGGVLPFAIHEELQLSPTGSFYFSKIDSSLQTNIEKYDVDGDLVFNDICSLSALNDHGMPFKEIADVIENAETNSAWFVRT